MLKNIADVRGFKCWGSHMGIKSKRRDLAMIVSDTPANAAAVFTRNVVHAEPIKISRENIKSGLIQAIVVNSGNANACTGKKGYEGAMAMVKKTAEVLKIKKEYVFVASTGIIGEPFPTEKILQGIEEISKKLSKRPIAGSLAANAILTTDTFAKEGFVNFKIGEKDINMAGIAKGSGMIAPNMGTMLGFIVCDAAISSPLLDKALKKAVDKSFNMITVDGDTSTNDCVAVMCNGRADNPKIEKEGVQYEKFSKHLEKLCEHLAKLIVSDGEGSTKFVEYTVTSAPSDEAATQIAKTIANSNLVKTALFGRDPNWGRIFAAAGRAGVDFDPQKVSLYIGGTKGVQILKDGEPTDINRNVLKKKMRPSNIKILLELNQGHGEATAWGSDLTYEYVRINAEYTT